jgi:hypothetical protein
MNYLLCNAVVVALLLVLTSCTSQKKLTESAAREVLLSVRDRGGTTRRLEPGTYSISSLQSMGYIGSRASELFPNALVTVFSQAAVPISWDKAGNHDAVQLEVSDGRVWKLMQDGSFVSQR